MSFTARRISMDEGPHAFDGKLVRRREEVARLRDAEAIVDRARRTAVSIVKAARDTAKLRKRHSIAAWRARHAQMEREFAERAIALDQAYRTTQASLTAQLEATLDRVLAAALAHVGARLPAGERLRIVCEQLREAAGPTPAARLLLCPADEAIYRRNDIGSPWPAEIDETLAPGCCRLVGDEGEWVLAFDALMASLGPMPASAAHGVNDARDGNRASVAEVEPANARA